MKVESPQVDLDNEMDEEHSPKLFSAQNPADSFVFDTKIDELALKLRETLTDESVCVGQAIGTQSERKASTELRHSHVTTTRSLTLADDEMETVGKPYPASPGQGKKRDWKIPRFLRRTQSATEDDGQLNLHGQAVGGCSGGPFYPAKLKDEDRCRNASSSKLSSDPSPHSSINDRDRPRSSSEVEKESGSNKWRGKGGTEMKFGLGFLKRRHTEGQIVPPSVRPSPEEAKKWSESFQTLMMSKYGQCLFKAFLRREFSHENIEFWIAVEQYRKARERKLPAKAQKIINEFVLSESPREVNLDSVTKGILINTTSFSQPDYSTFDQAQRKIQSILEADAYIRFLQSDLYLELVYPDKYPANSPSNILQSDKGNTVPRPLGNKES